VHIGGRRNLNRFVHSSRLVLTYDQSREPHNLVCARKRRLGEAVFRQDGGRHEPPAEVVAAAREMGRAELRPRERYEDIRLEVGRLARRA